MVNVVGEMLSEEPEREVVVKEAAQQQKHLQKEKISILFRGELVACLLLRLFNRSKSVQDCLLLDT